MGDSRAVLGHGNGVTALSDDHKPSRVDEKRRSALQTFYLCVLCILTAKRCNCRITNAGGKVLFNGVWRVEGSLAVSRAFGDLELKRRGAHRFGNSPRTTRGFGSPPRSPASPSMGGSPAAQSPSSKKQEGYLVTARPEVFEYELSAAQDDFVVLATDGLWDVMRCVGNGYLCALSAFRIFCQ